MKIINIGDNNFPLKLKSIPNPPQCLYTEGNLNLLNSNSIAIIGSRQASDNGKKLAEKFSRELSQIGLTIVSGLALGIDTIAHTFSYSQKGKTIAVLGSGFNKIFPEKNYDLYQKILENDGLIISEYPPEEEAISNNFRERNRLISGLSLGVLIIEAKYRSGTSITAKCAITQKKPIFTLPHEISNPNGVGTNRLLKNGANLITDTIDILNYLKLNRLKKMYLNLKESEKIANSKILFSNIKESNIYNCINNIPISVNDLVRKSGYSINEILSILFTLEINGYIKKVQGGYVCM